MKSLFARNFAIYALVIVLGFVILGSAFISQVNRFALQEKQQQLADASERAVQFTVSYFTLREGSEWNAQLGVNYRMTMHMLASDCNGTIFVGDRAGSLLFIADPDGCYSQEDNGLSMPQSALDALFRDGRYAQTSNFYGFLSSQNYVMGRPVISDGETIGAVFVCMPAEATEALFMRLSRVFILLTIGVLFLTLVATIIVTRSTVKPLKNMAAAARSFAQGDYSARAPLPKQQDELYDLTISFNRMAESMQNAEEARRGLIASVSHDLRTPMTTIAGFVDGILEGTIKPDKQAYYLHIISDEIKRLTRLANGMLSVSRLESGQALNPSLFDVSEMVRRIVIGFERQLTEKHIELQLDIPEQETIRADHDGLFQAVYNLIDNAVKFTPERGEITIYMAENNNRLQFNIRNSGSEIPSDKIKFVFDRFYKGDTSRNRNSSGSGLGLYITKTVIQRHGGDIYVRSGDDRTEFCFTIPLGR